MNLMESHDDQCEWCSEACGCDSRASLHGLLRKAADEIESLQKQLAAAKEDAEYAWRNMRIFEASRNEESAKLRAVVRECRSSVKFDCYRYERMAIDYGRLGPEGERVCAIANAEAQRLHELLEEIDALNKEK